MEGNNKPKIFIVLKILGFLLLVCGITLIIVGATKKVPHMGESGWFDAESSKSGFIFGGVACCIFSIPAFVLGFMTSITKTGVKITKHIHEETKDDMMDIFNSTSEMIKKTREAFTPPKEYKEKVCPRCGATFEQDDANCKYCGGARK